MGERVVAAAASSALNIWQCALVASNELRARAHWRFFGNILIYFQRNDTNERTTIGCALPQLCSILYNIVLQSILSSVLQRAACWRAANQNRSYCGGLRVHLVLLPHAAIVNDRVVVILLLLLL